MFKTKTKHPSIEHLVQRGCTEVTSKTHPMFHQHIFDVCEEHGIRIFLLLHHSQAEKDLHADHDQTRFGFTYIGKECIFNKMIFIYIEDFTSLNLCKEMLELTIWHEIGHIIENTKNELIADLFALVKMCETYDCYFANRIFGEFILKQYGYDPIMHICNGVDDRYRHRLEYIKSHDQKELRRQFELQENSHNSCE